MFDQLIHLATKFLLLKLTFHHCNVTWRIWKIFYIFCIASLGVPQNESQNCCSRKSLENIVNGREGSEFTEIKPEKKP